MTVTHTYVLLEVSREAYDEIRGLLEEAGYQHAFEKGLNGREAIDMHGIALQAKASDLELARLSRDTMLAESTAAIMADDGVAEAVARAIAVRELKKTADEIGTDAEREAANELMDEQRFYRRGEPAGPDDRRLPPR